MSRKESQIRSCEALSKDWDESEYRISADNFEDLWRTFGPFQLAMFASNWTYQMVPFFSKFLCPGSAGTDAFAQDWKVGNLFCHPPIGEVYRVFRMKKSLRLTEF